VPRRFTSQSEGFHFRAMAQVIISLGNVSRITGTNVTWDQYLQYQTSQAEETAQSEAPSAQSATEGPPSTLAEESVPAAPSNAPFGGASAPLSFNDLVELINSGQEHLILNNEKIPNKLAVSYTVVCCAFASSALLTL
jgi:hypothetical protein